MYKEFFGFTEPPFSIVPSSRYLFLSHRHREAMQHLQAGLGDGGGFALLTGEVGTGKTTIARAMLAALDDSTLAGFILNPTFSNIELLEAICDEFALSYPPSGSLKALSQVIYHHLLHNHAQGKQTLLVIDEAQHLAADVLEQLRLLTNLETESRKLLKVLLIGQPELQQKLQLPQLRQLAQRITGRYHLLPLNVQETEQYIHFRLALAGGHKDWFDQKSIKWIAEQTHGIPRLINLVCDASFKLAYQQGVKALSFELVRTAGQEVMNFQSSVYQSPHARLVPSSISYRSPLIAGLVLAVFIAWFSPPWIDRMMRFALPSPELPKPITQVVISAQLEQDLERSKALEAAISDLYKVWGYSASLADSFCDAQAQGRFQCQRMQGDFNQLKQLNLPVVLTLAAEQTQAYAVLYQINAEQVQLLMAGKHVQINQSQLSDVWTGEYHYIWQHDLLRTLKQGMQGDDVELLDQKLSQLLGEQATGHQQFDGEVKRKVAFFQRWQKMDSDGIAGARTISRLELLTQHNAPRLLITKEQG
ncbi:MULTISPECIES: ExeA family protein [Vibrio]|uniref:ExeA family protein n=1 Tax=Vibrio TaxID=662 RepID=UPI001482A724|nr:MULTISPECIES: ExeA family protein [Vibrio]MDQ2163067.1 AAA family ATPase [Vibrio anguillarum]NNN94471.1 AAA family ATPase [Vibrio sp. B4-6]